MSRGWKVWIEPSGKNRRVRWKGKYGTGQQVFVYKDDALDLLRDKRRDFQRLDAGLPAAQKIAGSISVGDWWVRYSKTKRRENPATFRRFDEPAIKPFVETYARTMLGAITKEIVEDYKYVLEERYSGDTPLMYYRQLCAFFNSAVRAGELERSPAKSVRRPISGGCGGRPLTDSELMVLLSVAPEALYRTAVFSMNTRLRINEVCIFDWAWVSDIETGGWIGKIPRERRKTRAKSKEDCIFAINDAARAVMGERRISGRVFPWSASTIQHQMTQARRLAKLPEDVTFHCFRHTGASRYLGTDGPDGGHMEDLLKTHVWDDPRSLLRYVKPAPATLLRRANAVRYPIPAPTWPLNAKGRPPKTLANGPAEGHFSDDD